MSLASLPINMDNQTSDNQTKTPVITTNPKQLSLLIKAVIDDDECEDCVSLGDEAVEKVIGKRLKHEVINQARYFMKKGVRGGKGDMKRGEYEEDYHETRIQKPIGSLHMLKVPITSPTEEKGLKWASLNDILLNRTKVHGTSNP